MQYSCFTIGTIGRTLAVIAIFAVIFGLFNSALAFRDEVLPSAVDICSNLDGVQTTVPAGMFTSEGICTPLVVPPAPIIDLCLNIEGAQLVVPEGMILNNGNCGILPTTVRGCMDVNANNYNVEATVGDESCTYDHPDQVMGCTDTDALNYNADATENDNSCQYAAVTNACHLTVVSDSTNIVLEKDNANAVLTWVHPHWITAIASSTAKWIWGSATVENPTSNETETFVKKFNWNGPITAAVLTLAADNSYVVTINGSEVALDLDGNNSTATDEVDLASYIVTGENTLEVKVINNGFENATSETNPAGTLYNLTITGNSNTDCTKTPTDHAHGTDAYKLFGFVWNDTDKDAVIDENEDTLSDWSVRAVNASNSNQVFTTTSGEKGRYSLIVPAGKWIISELTPDGWVLLTSGDGVNGTGTYTVTVPVVNTISFMNWFIPTAEASCLCSSGPYNFGNNVADSTGTTHHHHSSSNSNSGGQVLGDGTSKAPEGEVLGAATTTMPVGAPNTGAGGTSPISTGPTLNAILSARLTARKSK